MIIIYGLIMSVVTLTVSSLVYFGVFDIGKMLPEKCNTGSALRCENYQMKAVHQNQIQIEFKNNVGRRITFADGTKIMGEDDWEGIECTVYSVTPENYPDPRGARGGDRWNAETGVGENVVVAFDCEDITTEEISQRFKATIILEYKTTNSDLDHKSTGPLFLTISPGDAAPPPD